MFYRVMCIGKGWSGREVTQETCSVKKMVLKTKEKNRKMRKFLYATFIINSSTKQVENKS